MIVKRGIICETLGSTGNLKVIKESKDGLVRLNGVFGVCGLRNNNGRVYEKRNYGNCVAEMQQRIASDGILGELEHPTSCNINLNNVSHKIESIIMNEDGTITGTIALLDTQKGKDARAIVESGCPLFISSRAAGTVDASGNVTLQHIQTYDLVGTPGFSQAKLNLSESQTCECLNESLNESHNNEMWMIVESVEDDGKQDDNNQNDKPKDNAAKNDNSDDNNQQNDKVTMEELKKSIDELTKKVSELEGQLHIANEAKASAEAALREVRENAKSINYKAIQRWVEEQFAPELKESVIDETLNKVQDWVIESVSPKIEAWVSEQYSEIVQDWITEEFTETIQNWITEEYSPVVQDWITEHYSEHINNWIIEEIAPKIQSWITEEYSPTIQKWIHEEYSPMIEGWINEECMPEYEKQIVESTQKSVSEFLESQKEDKFESVDKIIESLQNSTDASKEAAIKMLKEERTKKFAGVYVVENMPAKYQPIWESLSDEKQMEIIKCSRMYDFTKPNVLEQFWGDKLNISNVQKTLINENANSVDDKKTRLSAVASKMRMLGFGR